MRNIPGVICHIPEVIQSIPEVMRHIPGGIPSIPSVMTQRFKPHLCCSSTPFLARGDFCFGLICVNWYRFNPHARLKRGGARTAGIFY
jgi:hypothetical protein